MAFVVAIDGPAGTGKSSVARELAQKFDFIYVDTGAIYRAIAFLVEKYSIDPRELELVMPLIKKIAVKIDEEKGCIKIEIDHQVIDEELRTENVSRLSSIISQHKKLRENLLPIQRGLIGKIKTGAIFEGRDIGTVVFPDASIKLFITANCETRAMRRFKQIKSESSNVSYEQILSAIKKRDERDENRPNAPMQKAPDAFEIDSSTLTLAEVIKVATDIIISVTSKQK